MFFFFFFYNFRKTILLSRACFTIFCPCLKRILVKFDNITEILGFHDDVNFLSDHVIHIFLRYLVYMLKHFLAISLFYPYTFYLRQPDCSESLWDYQVCKTKNKQTKNQKTIKKILGYMCLAIRVLYSCQTTLHL